VERHAAAENVHRAPYDVVRKMRASVACSAAARRCKRSDRVDAGGCVMATDQSIASERIRALGRPAVEGGK